MRVAMSYALFGDPDSFEFGFYLRGLYFNLRMDKILFPSFERVVYIEGEIYREYSGYISHLTDLLPFKTFTAPKGQRCESMLRRMLPIFMDGVEYVICRDLDSVSTYREALCTYEWLNSGMPYHAINDNAAHGGLMGGLVSFKSEDFKRDTKYTSFDQMVKGLDLKAHGSDQNFMNKFIHPKIKHGLMMHKLKGAGIEAKVVKTEVPASGPIDKKYQYSDLISRYIGSAGVIDFELLRWFKAHDPNPKWDAFETKFKDICYWKR